MGLLIDGQWHDQWYDTSKTQGRFVRQDSSFRHSISQDPNAEFPFEPNRYHLYVSYACPWAHRTLIARKLKQLEDKISVSAVHWLMLERGWVFNEEYPDSLNRKSCLYELYQLASPNYTGRVTVPILWDKQAKRIVNNESSEIVRLFNSEFQGSDIDLYPINLREEIDSVNAWVYDDINNGVYKAGFATTQEAYQEAVEKVFQALSRLEQRLSKQSYLVGGALTEADIRLFTTLVRFDAVYVGHFKCNWQRLVDYKNLWAYTRRIYNLPGVAETVHFDHIKNHYYQSHRTINPSGIVPTGPNIEFGIAL